MVKKRPKKKLHPKKSNRKIFRGKIDRGTIFIVVILTTWIFGGYLFVGGTIPQTIPKPRAEGIVAVDLKQKFPVEQGLQLHTFQGATITPYPTQGPGTPQPSTIPIEDAACNGLKGDANKLNLIRSYRVAATPASGNQQSLQVFYAGTNAITAGTTPMTKSPTDHRVKPTGNANAKDPNGFPFAPAVFVTDISANAGDTSGDAQSGGVPQFASDIYGAWKTETGPNPVQPNNQILGTGADPLPPANGPGGGAGDTTFTAELIWKITDLKTKTGGGLEAGKTYRLQIVLHSGAKNEEVVELCTTVKL